MAATRKQLAFDLDTKALKTCYPGESWNNAYEIIKRHMLKNNFSWLQGSVYVSVKSMTSAEITNILDELLVQNPWLNLCMRDCREANIGREHSKNYLFDKNADIPARQAPVKNDGSDSSTSCLRESNNLTPPLSSPTPLP